MEIRLVLNQSEKEKYNLIPGLLQQESEVQVLSVTLIPKSSKVLIDL